MSERISIKALLEGVEVEWKKLGEVCKVLRGKRLTKKELIENGKYPVFHGGLIPLGFYNKYNRKANQTMIINTGSIGEVVWSGVDFWSSDGTFVIETSNITNDKFLYYFLKTKENYFKSQRRIGGVPTIDRIIVEKLQIPIPPLKIQSEIVRILDNFTELTAELTAELSARKKQYQFYKDKLLSFEDGEVEWKKLGEVAKIYDGTHQTPKYTDSGVPFVSVQNIKNIYATDKYISIEDFKKYKHKPCKNDIFMTRIGDIGTCALVKNNEPLAYYVTLTLIRVNEKLILPMYFKYVIESYIGKRELYKRTLVHATPIKINLREIDKIEIPIPPLHVQQKIVSILDKFDTLTNSISEGLPREIELRQKQYEYYRDLLLTFPKNDVKA